jgi:hypothetical protein
MVPCIGPMSIEEKRMIIIGIICLVIGFILSIPVLWTIGIILVVIGLILWILGAMDHAVFGRRYWF